MSTPMEAQLREIAGRIDKLVAAKTPIRSWKPISLARVMEVAGTYVDQHAEDDMMTLYSLADSVEKLLEENYELRRQLGMEERKEVSVR